MTVQMLNFNVGIDTAIEEQEAQKKCIKTLREDENIFWEAFSADGIEMPVPYPLGNHDHNRNTAALSQFQHELLDEIENDNFDAVGRMIAGHMTDYVSRPGVWRPG